MLLWRTAGRPHGLGWLLDGGPPLDPNISKRSSPGGDMCDSDANYNIDLDAFHTDLTSRAGSTFARDGWTSVCWLAGLDLWQVVYWKGAEPKLAFRRLFFLCMWTIGCKPDATCSNAWSILRPLSVKNTVPCDPIPFSHPIPRQSPG